MNKLKISILVGACLLSLIPGAVVIPENAYAQSSGTSNTGTGGQALEIGPTVLPFEADPGQTVTAKIVVRDISSGSLVVTNEINDFVADDENGSPRILVGDDEDNPYSIKDWIVPVGKMTLKSKETKEIPISINVPATASPGGYYGVIRFTGTAPELEDTGVALSASLGTLIILTVNGDAKEGMAIQEFSVNYKGKTGTFFETAPIDFLIRLKNNGNIHEQPTGKLIVKDMFGNKVTTLDINQANKRVLPNSIRRFEHELGSAVIGNKMLFGHYTAELTMTYGKNHQTMAKTISFWVIPYTLIGFIILGLIGGFFALRILLKRYNAHILSTSSRRSRRR